LNGLMTAVMSFIWCPFACPCNDPQVPTFHRKGRRVSAA
jgi:hypothetical protein